MTSVNGGGRNRGGSNAPGSHLTDPQKKVTDALDIRQVNRRIQGDLAAYQGSEAGSSSSPARPKAQASKFQQGHPALLKETKTGFAMHSRTPELNKIPLFYCALETELARPADIQNLPDGRREAETVRLVAKRFIDSTTGKSLYQSASVGKANPNLHMQDETVRNIRSEAATATIARYGMDADGRNYIKDLYDHVRGALDLQSASPESTMHAPSVVYVVRPARDPYAENSTVNFLSVAAHTEVLDSLSDLARRDGISNLLHFSDRKNVPVVSRTARSNATPLGRLMQQGYFDTSQIRPGDSIVIADDHTQAGGTLLAMSAAIAEAGATVLAAVTATAHPLCTTLGMNDKVAALLHETLSKWDPEKKVENAMHRYGMPLDTLTNHEAMVLIAYAIDKRNPAALKAYRSAEAKLYGGNTVMEGESDSLRPLLQQSQMTPDQFVEAMDKEVRASRYVTEAAPIEKVYVLDWDDFLSDQKGNDYQLMHNALVTAANEHGDAYPIVREIALQVQNQRGQYAEGMPILCMPQKEFSDAAMHVQGFLRKDMVTDLLKKLDSLQPGLQGVFDGLKPARRDAMPGSGPDVSGVPAQEIDKANAEHSSSATSVTREAGNEEAGALQDSGSQLRSAASAEIDEQKPFEQEREDNLRAFIDRHVANARAEMDAADLTPQKRIENILYNHFLRQYQLLVRPEVRIASSGGKQPELSAMRAPASSPENSRSPAAESSAKENDRSIGASAPQQAKLLDIPFPDVSLSLLPGAQERLDEIRRPENYVALISNRVDRDLEKEVNKLQLMHQFDEVSGTPERTVPRPIQRETLPPYASSSAEDNTDAASDIGRAARLQSPASRLKSALADNEWVVQRLHGKPKSARLEQVPRNRHGLDNAEWYLAGDKAADIRQVVPLVERGEIDANKIHAALVTPDTAQHEKMRQEIRDNPSLDGKIDLTTVRTLNDESAQKFFKDK